MMRKESIKPEQELTWIECAKWLSKCGVMNNSFRERLRSNVLTISDLWRALQDGVILCSLMNIISSGSIDASQIYARAANFSRMTCIANIKLFLEACKREFSLVDTDLFEPSMLYDSNIECVINALSTISRLDKVQIACGQLGFNVNVSAVEDNLYDEIISNDDLAASYDTYVEVGVLIGGNESVYDLILGDGNRVSLKLENKDFIIREIYNTEKRFVETLRTIVEDFIGAVSKVLDDESMKIVFINVKPLYAFHVELLDKLKNAISGRKGRTIRVCSVINSAINGLLKHYTDFFIGFDKSIKKIDSLCFKDPAFRKLIDSCCQNTSLRNVKLTDLLVLPFQHLLRYDLLLSALHGKIQEKHEAKMAIQETCSNLKDMGTSLNQVKYDQESLDHIERISHHLKGFRFSRSSVTSEKAMMELARRSETMSLHGEETEVSYIEAAIYDDPPNEDADAIYTSANAILENVDSLFCKSSSQPLEVRNWQIRQLFYYEIRFVNTLKITIHYFSNRLSILSDTEKHEVFINLDLIEKLHSELLSKLYDAIKGDEGRTSRICSVFSEFKDMLIELYSYYGERLNGAQAKIRQLLTYEAFSAKIEECRQTSGIQNKMKFQDLILTPFIHISKYKLHFIDLKKKTDENHSALNDIDNTIEIFHEITHRLNESCKNAVEFDSEADLHSYLPYYTFTCLKEFGHILKDDKIQVKESNELAKRTRVVILFCKALFICTSSGEDYVYRTALLLNEYRLLEYAQNRLDLLSNDDKLKYSLSFKNKKQCAEWKILLCDAIDKVAPPGFDSNGHCFQLTNFNRDPPCCSFCNKQLKGIFYQGYKCTGCSIVGHKMCIIHFGKCTSTSSPTSSNKSPVQIKRRLPLSPTKDTKPFKMYTVISVYPFRGTHTVPHTECQPLAFKRGEQIEVTDDDDDDWWKGYKVDDLDRTVGFFPSKNVQKLDVHMNPRGLKPSISHSHPIESYIWYCRCMRADAVAILERIPYSPHKIIFMVRPSSDQGTYCVTIKYNSQIQHIRIVENEDGVTRVKKYRITQNRSFLSISELVNFYMRNSLEDVFEGITTTFDVAYKDALPPVLCEVVAMRDYEARSKELNSLKRDERYWVISKENREYWKIYNRDGLIGYAPSRFLKVTF